MSVRVIPISPAYRDGWEKTFGKIPPTPLIAPDSTGSASSAPRGATILDCFPDRVFMTSPLPASWGLVGGRPF
jgi:hypothetical protein